MEEFNYSKSKPHSKKTKTSEGVGQIAKALSQVQLEITNPANTATNPFFKSKYAPLPDVLKVIRPIASKYGLAIIQNPYTEDEKVGVITLIMHESGEWIETEALVSKPEKNTPQGIGSVITYLRRYTISSIVGISSEEDDDGNSNESSNKKKSEEGKKSEDTKEIDKIKKEITNSAQTKAAINNDIKESVKTILKKYHTSGNPNKIEDINEAKKCLKEINDINMEVK